MRECSVVVLAGILLSASMAIAEVIQYHPNSPAYIGGNFDPSRPGQAFPECLERSTVRAESLLPNQQPGTPAATQFFIKKVSSRQELYRLLNVSLSMSGSYGLFSADFSGSLEQENTFKEESFTWVIQGYSNFGKFILESVKLNAEARALKDNPSAFRNRCGTDYIGIEVRAVQAAAVFTIKNLSESERKVLEASFSASYGGGGPLSIGGDAKYQEFVKKAAQYGQIEVNVYAIGGTGVSALAPIITSVEKPDDVLKTIQSYFANLTLERSAAVSYNTGSLQSLVNHANIETDIYNKFIAQAFLQYEELGAELNRLNSIRRAQEDWNMSASDQQKLTSEINLLAKLRNDALLAAQNCKKAFNSNVSADKRQSVCTATPQTFIPYERKLVGLSAKPYYLRYFVTNELIPGEEVLNFTLRGATIKNVQLVKKLNVQSASFAAINAVQIHKAADGSRESGTSLVMKDVPDVDLPVGLRIEVDSGRIYFEPFVFTRAPVARPMFLEDKNKLQPKGPSTSKADFESAYLKGNLVPEEYREKR